MNQQILGTCSLCGGIVTAPIIWHSVNLPPSTCQKCRATGGYVGPVIPMTPPRTGEAYDTRTRPIEEKPTEPKA